MPDDGTSTAGTTSETPPWGDASSVPGAASSGSAPGDDAGGAEPGPRVEDAPDQSSLAAPPAAPRGLSYAVDIVFCIDVTGSMTPIIDAVKANALRFYDDVQRNLTDKGKNVDELRVRVVAFRDFAADGEAALQESPFFRLPAEQEYFRDFVDGSGRRGWG